VWGYCAAKLRLKHHFIRNSLDNKNVHVLILTIAIIFLRIFAQILRSVCGIAMR
jgi:hypothetical protein